MRAFASNWIASHWKAKTWLTSLERVALAATLAHDLLYRHILEVMTIGQIRHKAVAGTRSTGRLSGCLENVLEVIPTVVLDLNERKE